MELLAPRVKPLDLYIADQQLSPERARRFRKEVEARVKGRRGQRVLCREHISADYYGMYCEALKRLQHAEDNDPPFVALMANSTSGDVNNNNFRTPRAGKKCRASRCASSPKMWWRR